MEVSQDYFNQQPYIKKQIQYLPGIYILHPGYGINIPYPSQPSHPRNRSPVTPRLVFSGSILPPSHVPTSWLQKKPAAVLF
jgi:hypothetical protein